MPLHTAMIGGVQVPGFRYVVYGTVRGYVSTHWTKRAAEGALAEDAQKQLQASTWSDALIYRWRDGWELVGKELDVELVEPEGE